MIHVLVLTHVERAVTGQQIIMTRNIQDKHWRVINGCKAKCTRQKSSFLYQSTLKQAKSYHLGKIVLFVQSEFCCTIEHILLEKGFWWPRGST
jgi:hypothetical protein